LDGVTVADFTWAAAGPIITKNLADHGATVIRVESSKHPDSVRFGGPFKDDVPGINRSGFFADFNSSKKSVALDMSSPGGRQIARRLIDRSDLLIESFTPKVMPSWGFTYEELSKTNPGLIMLSTCLHGSTGPHATYAGYGGQGAALAGIHGLTGWPDRPPAGPKGAYTDTITPRYGLAAVIAALIHRATTGQGQHIDLAQIEASVQFLTTELVDYQLTGSVAQRRGNRSLDSAPCGVYPCAGDDRWIAIEVRRDEQWRRLADLVGGPPAADHGLASAAGRLARADELDAWLSDWTRTHPPFGLQGRLQQHGIPASVAQRGSDLFNDPQLLHRGHFVPLEHPEMGVCYYGGPSAHLSATPARLRSAAPTLGQHTEWVMKEYLGYTDAEYAAYQRAGVLR
jgi:benzylsuccinate CoA-transferase BbsF subunit